MDRYEVFLDAIDKPTWKVVLIDTLKSSDMDPWDIDVSKITTMFLDKINSMRTPDFRVPANAVLASSILVRFKSDVWELYPQDRFEDDLEDATGTDYVIDGEHIPELGNARRITQRRVTIKELIKAVEDVMNLEKRRAIRARERAIPPQLAMLAAENTIDFEVLADEVYDKVVAKKDESNLVLFSTLVNGGTKKETVETLIPLLFLANQERIAMWQDKVFGEIFISIL